MRSEAATLFPREVPTGRRVHAAVASLFPGGFDDVRGEDTDLRRNSQVFLTGCRIVFVALLVAVGLSGCASVAPGSDPVVVHTQQALRAADAIYREGMAYYFTPGVATTLSPGAVKAFEAVRTGFDPAYKTAQAALEAYQAGKRKDVIAEMAALAKLMNAILPYFVHPNIQALPVPVSERLDLPSGGFKVTLDRSLLPVAAVVAELPEPVWYTWSDGCNSGSYDPRTGVGTSTAMGCGAPHPPVYEPVYRAGVH